MSIEADVRLQFASYPDFDLIVAEVYFKRKYMFLLSVRNAEPLEIDIHLEDSAEVADLFVGNLDVEDYLRIINFAKDRYRYRLTKGANPFDRSLS